MSISLPLVIEAVNLVDEAAKRRRALDIGAAALELHAAHPESGAAPEDIAALLRHEQESLARVGAWGDR